MEFHYITGGVTAPKGFQAAGASCGIKAAGKPDIALILSQAPCTAAGVFTSNLVKAAPIFVTQDHLADGHLQGIVVNSGNANALAPQGKENARRMAQAAAQATGLAPEDFGVASTGIIGVPLPIGRVESGIAAAASALSAQGSDQAARAILTSDTKIKTVAIEVLLRDIPVRIGAIAKGSGMIHPNMGTTLSFLTTDCAIPPEMLQALLREAVDKTLNRITVDGDTSTNDTCLMLANAQAGNLPLVRGSESYRTFSAALLAVCGNLARAIAADGEGSSRLISVTVSGARSEEEAVRLARSVAGSSLVKAALFGADANWGRVLCAMGYAGVPFDPETVSVRFSSSLGEVLVCRKGEGVPFENGLARAILDQKEVSICISLGQDGMSATCWGCDLTHNYVSINGHYRS